MRTYMQVPWRVIRPGPTPSSLESPPQYGAGGWRRQVTWTSHLTVLRLVLLAISRAVCVSGLWLAGFRRQTPLQLELPQPISGVPTQRWRGLASGLLVLDSAGLRIVSVAGRVVFLVICHNHNLQRPPSLGEPPSVVSGG